MSDLKKELNEVAPPKPKKKEVKQKAKKSAKQILARTRTKVAKAEQTLRSAKRHAENVKSKFMEILNNLLDQLYKIIDELHNKLLDFTKEAGGGDCS